MAFPPPSSPTPSSSPPPSAEYRGDELQPGTALTPAVLWLIGLNVAVYFVQVTTMFGPATVTEWLALRPGDFPSHWWTVGTYMFVHAGLAHLATNTIILWMFGPRVERAFGTRSFVSFYLWAGLGGAIFHLLFVRSGAVVGASGAVVGVVLAYALRWPDDEVYLLGVFAMRARWLAVWTIAWNVGMALADATGYTVSSTAWMTHVGGLAFAWLFLHAPTSAALERIRRHVATVPDETGASPVPRVQRTRPPDAVRPPAPPADEAVARSNALVRRRPTPPALPAPAQPARPEDVNAVLDKISREGLASLTLAERRMLEDVSRRLRGGA